jgi:hypothetical protein
MKWLDSRKYVGAFANGKEEGEGTFKWPNGNMYIGKWKNGHMHGLGLFLNMEEMNKRQGEWKDGKRAQWLTGPESINTEMSPVKRSSYMNQKVMS